MATTTLNLGPPLVGGFDPKSLASLFAATLEVQDDLSGQSSSYLNPDQWQAAQAVVATAQGLKPWTTATILGLRPPRFGTSSQAHTVLNQSTPLPSFDIVHPDFGAIPGRAPTLPFRYLAAEIAQSSASANVVQKSSEAQSFFGRQSQRKSTALKELQESDLFREELRQISVVKAEIDKQRTALNRIGDTLIAGLKQCTPQQMADRLRANFDERNNLELLQNLSAKAGLFAGGIEAVISDLLTKIGTDDIQARDIFSQFVQSLALLDKHADAKAAEDVRLKLIKSELMGGMRNASALDISEKLRGILNPRQKTLLDVIDDVNAESKVFDAPILKVITALALKLESTADADVARSLVREFKSTLDVMIRDLEKTANRKVQEGLTGLLAQQHFLRLDLRAIDINGEVEKLRSRVASLHGAANYVERGIESGNERMQNLGTETAGLPIDDILARVAALRSELGEFAPFNGDPKLIAGNSVIRKLIEESNVLAREVQRLNTEASAIEKEESRLRSTKQGDAASAKKEEAKILRERSRTLTEGRLAEIKAEIERIQGVISVLRDEAKALAAQANMLADAEISSFFQAVARVNEVASAAIVESFIEEGGMVSELVREALYYAPEEFETYLDDVTKSDGSLFKAKRRQYYELLAVAARIYRDAVETDRRRFEVARKKGVLSKTVLDKMALRERMYDGMTLSQDVRATGRFYDDMPEDLELPDRIPLFARPNNSIDRAYVDNGELPRFFDLALGTAVMFPHDGEVLPDDKGVSILFHGAGTENSSINSLGLLLNIFTSNFKQEVDGKIKRHFGMVAVSNPFHEFGPHDPAFMDMDVVTKWADAVVERYLVGHRKKTLIAPGRSLGGNLVAEYAWRIGRVPVVAQSMYNPTPYCTWYDLQALKTKGRKINENAIKWLDILDKQWTFHLAGTAAPRTSVYVFSGLKDDYLQETPESYPQEFLDEHPEFIGVKPTDLGLRAFLESIALYGGDKVELVLFPNGGHFLFNEAFENPETIADALSHLGQIFDKTFR